MMQKKIEINESPIGDSTDLREGLWPFVHPVRQLTGNVRNLIGKH